MVDKDKAPAGPDLSNLKINEDGTLADFLGEKDQIIHSRVPGVNDDDSTSLFDEPGDKDDLDNDSVNEPGADDKDVLDDDDPGKDKGTSDGDKGKGKQAGAKTFESKEAAEEAYTELEKTLGKQGAELGELRKEVKELALGKAPDATKPVVDPIDAIAKSTAAEFAKLTYPAEDADSATKDKYNEDLAAVFAKQTQKISEVQQSKTTAANAEQVRQLKYIDDRLAEEGLSKYKDHFYSLSAAVPRHIKTVEAAVEWGVEQIKSVISIADGKSDDDRTDSDAKDSQMPGGKRRFPKVKGKAKDDMADVPDSVGGMIGHLADLRRVKSIH